MKVTRVFLPQLASGNEDIKVTSEGMRGKHGDMQDKTEKKGTMQVSVVSTIWGQKQVVVIRESNGPVGTFA